jgi:hypothetical protein
MALSGECNEHGWSWDPADDMGCPVCYGIDLGQKRVIGLMEDAKSRFAGTAQEYLEPGIDLAIALIKGENK